LVAPASSALLTVASLGVMAPPAGAATAVHWTGASTTSQNWSDAANWSPSVPATGDDVTFGVLAAGCNDGSDTTSACYSSNNDLTGLSLNSLTFADPGIELPTPYFITGNPITLGVGGLTDNIGNGGFGNTASIDTLILGADQTWQVNGGGSLALSNPLTGSPANSRALDVPMQAASNGDSPTLSFIGDNEIGNATFHGNDTTKTGSNAGANGIIVFDPDTNNANASGMNSTSTHPVEFRNVQFNGGGPFSAMTFTGGELQVGNTTDPTDANKQWIVQPASLTLDSASLVDEPISGPATGTDATAGTHYGQINSAGAVDLGSAELQIENFDADARFCPAIGTKYTLVHGQSVTGQFRDTNGAVIADGGVIPLTCAENSTTSVGLSINYTATDVTATAVSPPPGAESSNSATTTDPSQPATASDNNYSATGSGGTGTVIVSTFGGNPTPADSPSGSTGNFLDVRLSSDSTFTKVVATADGVPSDASLSWFDQTTSTWKQVVGDPGPTVTNGKLSVTLDANSSPNLTQLKGTVFGVTSPSAVPPASGYHLFASDGGVFSFNAPFFGSMGGKSLNKPIVGGATGSDGSSYYLVASDGGIFNFGPGAPFAGSTGGMALNKPIVSMAVDPATGGYWLVASDGGVFSFNAPFLGSMGGSPLNQPIVGITAAPDGNGYYLVASDGGVFNFGSSTKFQGSMGGSKLNQPVVGMTLDAATGGYWLVASDGGIFSFNAPFNGSTGGKALTKPIVGMEADPGSSGYWLVASDGGVFAFNAPFQGSTGGMTLTKPVVGMAAG
jgi:hypothetical protein